MFVRDQLFLKCDKSHVQQLFVGGRCRDEAFYPLQLVEAILQSIALTTDHDAKILASVMGCRAMEEERLDSISAVTKAASTIPNVDDDKPVPITSVKKATGGVLPIAYHPVQFKARYIDEYTGKVLDPHLIQAAIMEESGKYQPETRCFKCQGTCLSAADGSIATQATQRIRTSGLA